MLKYNIRKRKHWVHPFFRENLNSVLILFRKNLTRIQAPEELNQDPGSLALSQAKSVLSRQRGICHIRVDQAPAQLTAQKQN
jgi:hypothetical protein